MWFHAVCANISAIKYDDILKKPDVSWFCNVCKQQRSNRRSTIIEQTAEKTPITKAKSQEGDQMSSKAVYSMFKDLQRDIADLKHELSTYKDIARQLTDENVNLRNENDNLRSQINNVEYQVETIIQNNINNNIVLYGVPQTESENLNSICDSLAAALEVDLQPNKIEVAFRKHISGTKSSGLPAPIVIRFNNNKTKAAVMAASKSHKINADIIDTSFEKRPIYITEQLTRNKQFIFKCARDKKREGKIKFAWSKNGEIYIRISENSPIIRIKRHQELNDI